jgi:hypothetical protein
MMCSSLDISFLGAGMVGDCFEQMNLEAGDVVSLG